MVESTVSSGNRRIPILLLMGPPGAGKGTQAKKLAETLKWIHIATGDIFREHLQKQTPLGKKIAQYVEKGLLVPDDVVSEIIASSLQEQAQQNVPGIILDGYPRTEPQAHDLEQILNHLPFRLLGVIFLHVDESVLRERIQKRAREEGRVDDQSEEIIQQRLQEYYRKTLPLERFYRARNQWFVVDGNPSVEQVFRQILTIVHTLIKTGNHEDG